VSQNNANHLAVTAERLRTLTEVVLFHSAGGGWDLPDQVKQEFGNAAGFVATQIETDTSLSISADDIGEDTVLPPETPNEDHDRAVELIQAAQGYLFHGGRVAPQRLERMIELCRWASAYYLAPSPVKQLEAGIELAFTDAYHDEGDRPRWKAKLSRAGTGDDAIMVDFCHPITGEPDHISVAIEVANGHPCVLVYANDRGELTGTMHLSRAHGVVLTAGQVDYDNRNSGVHVDPDGASADSLTWHGVDKVLAQFESEFRLEGGGPEADESPVP